MANFRKQRADRKRLRFSAMGKASQRIQAERRMVGAEQRSRDLAEIEIENLPHREGDAIGCLQWHDFRSGKVRRWIIRIGNRIDRVTIHSPGGRSTKSHGWTWVMDNLRKILSQTT